MLSEISTYVLGRDLQPTSRRSAQIDYALGVGEEVILAVELHKLESGTGTVSLLSEIR